MITIIHLKMQYKSRIANATGKRCPRQTAVCLAGRWLVLAKENVCRAGRNGFQFLSETETQCVYSLPRGVRNIVMSMSVCLVCLPVRSHISKTARPINCTKFSVRVACGRSSVLLWRRYDMLCTSGFVDDVIFSYSGLSALCIFFSDESTIY